MNTEIIKTLLYAEKFYPFRIHHKKGCTYDVPDREFAWVSPIGVFVAIESDGQRHLILNPALIEKITTYSRGSRYLMNGQENIDAPATKRDLAQREWKYMQNYADAKTAVVEQILSKCNLPR